MIREPPPPPVLFSRRAHNYLVDVTLPAPPEESKEEKAVRDFLDVNTHRVFYDKRILEYDTDVCCVVCLEKLEESKLPVIKIFKCSHIFHEKCLSDWIKRNLGRGPKCPHCNQ